MKTKIVATIGNKNSYGEAIFDLKGNRVPAAQLDYTYLVEGFCNNDVDLIRLNLSHIALNDLGPTFSGIKSALVNWESRNLGRRVAVLADLPGPKIRFRLDRKARFTVDAEFTVHFEKEVSSETEATVYVNDKPLKTAMKEFDGAREAGPRGRTDSFQDLMKQVRENRERALVLVGDGDVVMKVIFECPQGTFIRCRVVTVKNPEIQGNKGFTIKGVNLDIPSFTQGDQEKLKRLLETEYMTNEGKANPVIAFVGLSFTQSEDDVLRMKKFIEDELMRITGMKMGEARLKAPSIIAKIETEQGWRKIDSILDIADGIMVARGDLGLQMDIEAVPRIQKKLIQLCNKRGKPVITATEMLKSMTGSIEPTRAEATDVFNAILDGSDAVMTSDETACGRFPFHALQKMKKIAESAESYFEMKDETGIGNVDDIRRASNLKRFQEFLRDDFDRIEENNKRLRDVSDDLFQKLATAPKGPIKDRLNWQHQLYQEKYAKSQGQPTTNRITQATCTMSESRGIKAIVAATASGRTGRMLSRLRPSVIIIGITHDIMNMRKLLVSHGVIPVCIGKISNKAGIDRLFEQCRKKIKEEPWMQYLFADGDMIIFTAGTPLGQPGTTNMIQMRAI